MANFAFDRYAFIAVALILFQKWLHLLHFTPFGLSVATKNILTSTLSNELSTFSVRSVDLDVLGIIDTLSDDWENIMTDVVRAVVYYFINKMCKTPNRVLPPDPNPN